MSAQAYSKPTFALLFFGVAVTALVAQLKPTHVPTATDMFEQKTEVRTDNNSTVLARDQQSTRNLIEPISFAIEPADPFHSTAEKLNALAADFFTTPFTEETVSKWQYEIDSGSPFLAEMAGYLKLDKLYNIDLNLEANRLLTQTFTEQERSDEDTALTLQTFIDNHAEPYWPLSIIATAKSTPRAPHILLNHFDRDFLLKIERANLSARVAPLAPGIERLLKYHLKDAVEKSSGMYRIQRTYNIDSIERDFASYSQPSNDFFEFYNLVLQRLWADAVLKLQQSDQLSDASFMFLYDLIAANAPDALLDQGTLTQVQSRPDWWQQFFYFELCLKNDLRALNQLNQRLSLQFQCSSASSQPIETVQPINDRLLSAIWEDVLTTSNLNAEDIQTFLLTLSPSQFAELNTLNSHTIFDYLAKKKRIKVIRNAAFYQRIENNYQLWLSTTNPYVTDSLYHFSPLFHWFSSQRRTLKQSMSSDWLTLLPQLSDNIQHEMAQNLVSHVSAASVDESTWSNFQPLFRHLSDEDAYLLNQYAQLANGLIAFPEPNPGELSTGVKQRLKESSFEMRFNALLNQQLDSASNFDNFLQSAEQLMVSFANQYPESLMADELSEGFDNNAELTDFTRRHLERLWERSR